ncbi:hypothetical protein GZ78_14165 [Endozoicomonas numazuensis]|uniref:Uncharacterized protein n=1 Tax=Endozoicomonas numazuensis TaxID=1137799 RepID=A0A081NF21_9GAMM|nr:hypothetical protein GZ78_14165 [Endozoicomonas numazuensis]
MSNEEWKVLWITYGNKPLPKTTPTLTWLFQTMPSSAVEATPSGQEYQAGKFYGKVGQKFRIALLPTG